MVGMLAITAAGWLLAFSLCAVATRHTPRWAGDAAPWAGLGRERPALVNLVVTQGRLSGAAYPATVLDLAAKGQLVITQRMAGQLWCDMSAAAPAAVRGVAAVSGAAACALPPDVLPRLATTIVGRLTGPADRQPGGTPSPGAWS